jgi:hypothetical protein
MRVALVLSVLLAIGGTAEAKYNPCRSTGELWLAPSGSVARNAKLWLAFEEWREVTYRVRGGGIDRIVRARDWPLFLDLGVLAPATTYEVRVVSWADFPIARFTTGASTDDAPPPAPVIRSLTIAHPSDHLHAAPDDPGIDPGPYLDAFPDLPANDLAIDAALPADTVFVDVTIRDATSVHHAVLWRDDLRLLGRTRCGPQFHLPAGTNACVSLRAIDRAGNLGAAATRCADVIDRPGDTRRALIPLSRFRRPTAPHVRSWSAIAALALVAGLSLVTSVVGRRLAA